MAHEVNLLFINKTTLDIVCNNLILRLPSKDRDLSKMTQRNIVSLLLDLYVDEKIDCEKYIIHLVGKDSQGNINYISAPAKPFQNPDGRIKLCYQGFSTEFFRFDKNLMYNRDKQYDYSNIEKGEIYFLEKKRINLNHFIDFNNILEIKIIDSDVKEVSILDSTNVYIAKCRNHPVVECSLRVRIDFSEKYRKEQKYVYPTMSGFSFKEEDWIIGLKNKCIYLVLRHDESITFIGIISRVEEYEYKIKENAIIDKEYSFNSLYSTRSLDCIGPRNKNVIHYENSILSSNEAYCIVCSEFGDDFGFVNALIEKGRNDGQY